MGRDAEADGVVAHMDTVSAILTSLRNATGQAVARGGQVSQAITTAVTLCAKWHDNVVGVVALRRAGLDAVLSERRLADIGGVQTR